MGNFRRPGKGSRTVYNFNQGCVNYGLAMYKLYLNYILYVIIIEKMATAIIALGFFLAAVALGK